jgi:hypothetical protein
MSRAAEAARRVPSVVVLLAELEAAALHFAEVVPALSRRRRGQRS